MLILFKNAKILTLKNESIFNGDLLVKNNKIEKIANKINISDFKKIDKIIDCNGNVLMPGFKNAHAHSAMVFLRSYADDLPLEEWLQDKVFPLENKLQKDDIYHLSKVAFLEYISSGITSCFDMYLQPTEMRQASIDIGMRNVILCNPDNSNIDDVRKNIIFYNQKKDLVKMYPSFHSEYGTTKEQLLKILALSNELKLPLFTHCAETTKEISNSLSKHHKTPLQYLDSLCLFNNYGGGIFHGVYLNQKDMEILKKKEIFVCTCPSSNLKLASGIAPIKQLYDNGIKIAIGTDGPASNNALDMFREMYLTSVLSKYREKDPASISAFEILKMATVNGALMLGLNQSVFLEEGSFADMIMLDIHQPNMQPINNIIKNIVYSGCKMNVKMTMINGKILYFDQKFYLKENVCDIYKKAQEITDRIKQLEI